MTTQELRALEQAFKNLTDYQVRFYGEIVVLAYKGEIIRRFEDEFKAMIYAVKQEQTDDNAECYLFMCGL